jgi:hypothetical protein
MQDRPVVGSSLLLKIQWKEHHYLNEHGRYTVQDFKSMMGKSESTLGVKWQGFNKGKFYQSDSRALRLRKSSINIYLNHLFTNPFRFTSLDTILELISLLKKWKIIIIRIKNNKELRLFYWLLLFLTIIAFAKMSNPDIRFTF